MKRQEWRHRKKSANRKLSVTLAAAVLIGSSILPASGVIAEGLTNTSNEPKVEKAQTEETKSEKQITSSSIEEPNETSSEESTEPSGTESSSTEGTEESTDESNNKTFATPDEVKSLKKLIEEDSNLKEKDYTPQSWKKANALWGRQYIDFAKDIVNDPTHEITLYTPEDIFTSYEVGFKNHLVGIKSGDDLTAKGAWVGLIGDDGEKIVKFAYNVYAKDGTINQNGVANSIVINATATRPIKNIMRYPGGELYTETVSGNSASLSASNIVADSGQILVDVDDPANVELIEITVTINDNVVLTMRYEGEKKPVMTETINISGPKEVKKGDSIELQSTISPDDVDPIFYDGTVWKTDSDVVTLNTTNGRKVTVNGVKEGKATITATTVTGETASHVVTVKGKENPKPKIPATSLEVTPTNKKIKVGESFKIDTKVNPTNYTDKAQFSFNSKIVSVDTNGKVIGKTMGKTIVKVKAGKITKNVTVEVVKGEDPIKPIKTDVSKLEAAIKAAESKEKNKFTVESWQAANFKEVLPTAKDILVKAKDQNAKTKAITTQDEVDLQTKTVDDAIAKLVLKTDDKNNDGKGKGAGNGSGVDNNNNNNIKGNGLTKTSNKSNSKQGSKNNTGLPKTGETRFVIASLIGLEFVLFCGTVYVVRKRIV